MIVDASGQPADPPAPEESAARAAQDLLAGRREPFEWSPELAGLDVRATNELANGPNRARLKVFAPKPGVVVFFVYKDSQVPFSTDRFTYGVLTVKQGAPDQEEVHAVLDYMLSGLHPEQRPRCLKRAFPFTIPR